MNKKSILSGILVCSLAFSLGFISCDSPSGASGVTDINYGVAPVGDPTTTALTLTFDEAVSGLTASDITITDGSGSAAKGSLSGNGANWSLRITTSKAGTVSVAINKTGIESGAKTVELIIDTGVGYTVTPVGDPTTTALTLTFNEAVAGLTDTDITITNGNGSAAKGALTGSGAAWTLAVTTSHYGMISVSINKDGIHKTARSVTLMKDGVTADITYTVTPSGTPTTDTLTFEFDRAVTDLEDTDITITNGSGSAAKGALTGSGLSWTLDVTTSTAGTVSVTINKDGIENTAKSVTVVVPIANLVKDTVWLSNPVTYSQDGLSITGKIILTFPSSQDWTMDYKGSFALVYDDEDDPPITDGTYTVSAEGVIKFIPTDATEPNPAGGDMTATVSGSKLTLVNFGPMSTIIFNKQNIGENKYAGTAWRCTSSVSDSPFGPGDGVGEIVTFNADLSWTRPESDAEGTYLFNGDKAQLVPTTGSSLDTFDVTATLGSGDTLTIVTSTYNYFGLLLGTGLTITMTETFEKVTE